MAGMTTGNSDALIRSEIWSSGLKDVLQDSLMMTGYVDWMTEFPDGNTFTMPSIGTTFEAPDYVEDQQVQYQALDTGEWQFSITEYLAPATYITNKNKQDGFYMSQLESSFVPKMARAIAERVERDIFKEGQPKTGNPAGYQVAGNLNQINGAAHRWVGSDTVNSKHVVGPADFARAVYSLEKANVGDQNLIAIVDPSVGYHFDTLTNLVDASHNPRFEGIIADGITSGMRFVRNVYGVDIYTSNRLPLCGTAQAGTSETIDSVASGANCKGCIIFSATPDLLPFKGAWRQMPKVDGEYNKDFQREEYVTTARYGVKIFRPENLITVLTDPTIIS